MNTGTSERKPWMPVWGWHRVIQSVLIIVEIFVLSKSPMTERQHANYHDSCQGCEEPEAIVNSEESNSDALSIVKIGATISTTSVTKDRLPLPIDVTSNLKLEELAGRLERPILSSLSESLDQKSKFDLITALKLLGSKQRADRANGLNLLYLELIMNNDPDIREYFIRYASEQTKLLKKAEWKHEALEGVTKLVRLVKKNRMDDFQKGIDRAVVNYKLSKGELAC